MVDSEVALDDSKKVQPGRVLMWSGLSQEDLDFKGFPNQTFMPQELNSEDIEIPNFQPAEVSLTENRIVPDWEFSRFPNTTFVPYIMDPADIELADRPFCPLRTMETPVRPATNLPATHTLVTAMETPVRQATDLPLWEASCLDISALRLEEDEQSMSDPPRLDYTPEEPRSRGSPPQQISSLIADYYRQAGQLVDQNLSQSPDITLHKQAFLGSEIGSPAQEDPLKTAGCWLAKGMNGDFIDWFTGFLQIHGEAASLETLADGLVELACIPSSKENPEDVQKMVECRLLIMQARIILNTDQDEGLKKMDEARDNVLEQPPSYSGFMMQNLNRLADTYLELKHTETAHLCLTKCKGIFQMCPDDLRDDAEIQSAFSDCLSLLPWVNTELGLCGSALEALVLGLNRSLEDFSKDTCVVTWIFQGWALGSYFHGIREFRTAFYCWFACLVVWELRCAQEPQKGEVFRDSLLCRAGTLSLMNKGLASHFQAYVAQTLKQDGSEGSPQLSPRPEFEEFGPTFDFDNYPPLVLFPLIDGPIRVKAQQAYTDIKTPLKYPVALVSSCPAYESYTRCFLQSRELLKIYSPQDYPEEHTATVLMLVGLLQDKIFLEEETQAQADVHAVRLKYLENVGRLTDFQDPQLSGFSRSILHELAMVYRSLRILGGDADRLWVQEQTALEAFLYLCERSPHFHSLDWVPPILKAWWQYATLLFDAFQKSFSAQDLRIAWKEHNNFMKHYAQHKEHLADNPHIQHLVCQCEHRIQHFFEKTPLCEDPPGSPCNRALESLLNIKDLLAAAPRETLRIPN